jgi:LysM repeat protein
VGFLIFLAYVAQKRKKWIVESWVSYTVKGTEDITSLAKEHNVSWKMLARVNKLQPPYVLKKNQKIQVPPRD